MPLSLTPEQLRWWRMQRGGLITPFTDAPTAAAALVGIQAQIQPAAALALWNRTRGLDQAGFDGLLNGTRTLVKLWGQRGTLHLYATQDWPLLHAARSLNQTWWERQVDGDAAKAQAHTQMVEAVAALLRSRPSLGRSDLRATDLPLTEEMLSPWGGIFADLVRRGYACHAPRSGGEARIVAREQWLPDLDWSPPDPETANRTLARRYFAAYGPATLHDFAYWRSVRLEHARQWLADLAADLVEVEVAGQPAGLLLRADAEAIQATPPPLDAWPIHLLYRFDPHLLAHRNKDWVVPPAHYAAVWRPAGHIEGIVLAHGQGVATWRYLRRGRNLDIQVNPFGRLPRGVKQAVTARATAVAAFFGLALGDLTFAPVARASRRTQSPQ
jgi:hypothetical protein